MTRIQLIGDEANVGINAYLELTEIVDVPLNFAVSDIRDLSKRTGTFSKSIRVTGTKANCQILNQLFDVNIVSNAATFDINKRQQCLIEQDGIVVLDNAVMQLTDVIFVSMGGNDYEGVDYIITVKDTMSDFFTTLGNQRIEDIDFSDLNHTYNAAGVVATFPNDYTDEYKYLLPITDDDKYDLIEMKPAVFARTYWDRIHARAGYSWEWDDRDDLLFDQWIHPYNGEKDVLSPELLDDFRVIAEEMGTQTNSVTVAFIGQSLPVPFKKLDINTEIQDPSGVYDAANSEYDSPFVLYTPNTLQYQITFTFELRLQAFGASGSVELWDGSAGAGEASGIIIKPQFVLRKGGGTIVGTAPMIGTYVNPFVNSDGNGGYDILARSFDAFGGAVVTSGTATVTLSATQINDTDSLTLGTRVLIPAFGDWRWLQAGVERQVNTYLDITDITINVIPSSETVYPNMELVMNNYVFKNIKQSEYIKAIMTMGNLFCFPAENNPRKLIYKSKDAFYDSGAVRDWTEKLAKDRESKITFLPELTAKRLKISYSLDNDVLNQGYHQNVGEVYGEVEYEFDNEFFKNDSVKTVVFGATPFIYTSFGAMVLGINGVEPKTLPRVVIDGGIYSCAPYSIINYPGSLETVDEYPFAGHFDRPFNPSFDLNFGQCAYYFSDQYGTNTSNNLANLFWRRTMSQINSGKMLTAHFWLTAADIAEMRLNDKIYLLGQYWNINRVIDYNANKKQLTKVELITIDESATLPPFKTKPPIKPNPLDGLIGLPSEEMIKERNRGLNISPIGNMVIGKHNYIAPDVRNALVVGDDQFIEDDGIHTKKLFVNGAPIATPVRSYRANITQTGTNDPVVNWENNNLGGTPVWSRSSTGVYHLTLAGAFAGNVYVSVTNGESTIKDWQIGARKISDDVIAVGTSDVPTDASIDGVMTSATIVIEVY
jgi:hypothetical protein